MGVSVRCLVGAVVKNPLAKAGDIPGSARFPGGGNGNPLQYSCLENYMDRGAWWATVHGVAELAMTECIHTHTHTHIQTDRQTDRHTHTHRHRAWDTAQGS